ncbi:GAF domain-containing sensor histidine kinase [Verrucomicrobiota bacterium]
MAAKNIKLARDELIINSKLLDIYDQMIGNVHMPDVLNDAARVVQQAIGCERATIYLVINETQELESAAVIGNISQQIRVPIRPSSIAGYCAFKKKSFVVSDAYENLDYIDPGLKFDQSWDKKNNFRTRDVMCAPAIFRDEIMGVVQVINSNSKPFAESDLLPLESMARLVAHSLYHARIYDELKTMKYLKKEKAKFTRILVHELKSPAAGAKTMISTLQFVNKKNPTVTNALTKINTRMDHMLKMIEDVLHLSRINEGDPLGEIKTFDTAKETHEVCESYKEQAEAKGLEMVLDITKEEAPIRFDLKGYKMVVSNLVSNAVKYTNKGSVCVSLQANDSDVVLIIKDTGMGIPAEEIPKMFREFFRASNARKNNISGTGVGLAGIKEMVERFGGRLEFESKENEGSTFSVRFPISKEKPADSKL